MSTPAHETQDRQGIGTTLRGIREDSRRTAAQVSAALGWSPSKLSRIENGERMISKADLVRLLDHLAVPPTRSADLLRLAPDNPRRRTPRKATEAIPSAYETYTTLEAKADAILIYAPMVIPGLLQIPEYAQAIIHATPDPEVHFAEERIAKRLMRQAAVFARPAPPVVHVILDENALKRPIVERPTMRRQFLRIIEVSEAPQVTVQVLREAVGAHPGLSGAFTILRFTGKEPGSRVFLDQLDGGTLRSGFKQVARYLRSFEVLGSLAKDPAESNAILAAAAEQRRD